MSDRILSIAAVVLVAGCAPEPASVVSHQSVLRVATNGLALHESGERGHAGMLHTNCPFETTAGTVTGDYDLPDEDETVDDAGEDPAWGGETVLLTQAGQVHLLNKETGDYRVSSTDVPGVATGRLSLVGVVALVERGGGCAVSWLDLGAEVEVRCPDGFAVDPVDGTAWLGGDRIDAVRPDGTFEGDGRGDLLAWDPWSHALYVARRGTSTVRALEADGTVRWESELDGPIHALEHGGRVEAAVVSWERPDGRGDLSWLDAWSGALVAGVETPAPAPIVESSASGRVVALVLESEAHFFRVNAENTR